MKKIDPKNKTCIYLDQFVVSNLISDEDDLWLEIKNLLEVSHANNKIFCPLSIEHILETAKKSLENAIEHDEYFRKLSDNYIFQNDPFLTSQLISSLIRKNKFTLNTFLKEASIKKMNEFYSDINKNNEIFDQSIKYKTSSQNELRKIINSKADKKTETILYNTIKKLQVETFSNRLSEYIKLEKIHIRPDNYGEHQFPNWIDQLLFQLTYKHKFKEKQFKLLLHEFQKNGFDRIPSLDIKSSLEAYIAVKNKQENTADHIDLMRISSCLFSTDIFFTDKKRKFEICELQLDKKYKTKVFSGTPSDLIEFKNYLTNL